MLNSIFTVKVESGARRGDSNKSGEYATSNNVQLGVAVPSLTSEIEFCMKAQHDTREE